MAEKPKLMCLALTIGGTLCILASFVTVTYLYQ